MPPSCVRPTLFLLLASALPGWMPATAADYDMDCAIILCMAAGFPAEQSGTCSAAYGAMINRITDRPPKSPYGTCSTAGGGSYEPSGVSFLRPARQAPGGWTCDEDAVLLFDETADYGRGAPACHPEADIVPSTIPGRLPYLGHRALSEPAERVAFRFQMTLPAADGSPGWTSPLVLSNPETGFIRTLDPETEPARVLMLSGPQP